MAKMTDTQVAAKLNAVQTGDLYALGNLLRDILEARTNVAAAAQGATIADPAGGATVDAEARTAINAILVVLENAGLVATS